MIFRILRTGVLLTGLVYGGPLFAQFSLPDFDPSDLDPTNSNSKIRSDLRKIDRIRLDAISRDPRAGRDYTKIYLQNNTNEKISAAIRGIPFEVRDANQSTLAVYTGGSPFETKLWYNLDPGERVHVMNTNNGIVYTYAQGSSFRTSGRHSVNIGNGQNPKYVDFSTRYVGIGVPEDQTFGFSKSAKDAEVKISFTLLNGSGRKVEFRLPSGNVFDLEDGEKKRYNVSATPDELNIDVLTTGKTYDLTEGNHKFHWMKSKNRIGFDMKHDED